MADLTEDRITDCKCQPGKRYHFGIAAGVIAHLGLLALIDKNGLYNTTGGVFCPGLVVDYPTGGNRGDNSAGLDGAEQVIVESDMRALLDLSGTDTPTNAHIGRPVFAADNHTITLQPFHLTAVRPFVGYFAGVCGDQGYVDLVTKRAPSRAEMGEYVVAPDQTMAADAVLSINPCQDFYPVQGSGGNVTLTEDFPIGFAGQRVRLFGINNAAKVTIPVTLNVQLENNLPITLGAGDSIEFISNGDDALVEIGRTIVNAA